MQVKNAIITIFTGCLLTTAAVAEDNYIKVNGVEVPRSFADTLINEQKAAGVKDNEQLKEVVLEGLIRNSLAVAEARRTGLDKKPEVSAKVELASREALARAYIDDYLNSNPVTDDEIAAVYEEVKQRAAASNEYLARHILVKDEAKAKDIIAKLKKGAKFANLAKDSEDVGTRDKGGDLGWNRPDTFVQPFAAALPQLGKGKFSQTPVKTDFGYHVILVEDVRSTQVPSLDQLRPEIQQRVAMQKVTQLLENLRATAEIEINQ
jgi:peptidyl-prolyl cis-trans isomerase C